MSDYKRVSWCFFSIFLIYIRLSVYYDSMSIKSSDPKILFLKIIETVVYLTAYPGVLSLNPSLTTTFMETDHETISTVILPFLLIQKAQLSVNTGESMCTSYG